MLFETTDSLIAPKEQMLRPNKHIGEGIREWRANAQIGY